MDPGSPRAEMGTRKPPTNPSTPHDLFNMFGKNKESEEGDYKKDGSSNGK